MIVYWNQRIEEDEVRWRRWVDDLCRLFLRNIILDSYTQDGFFLSQFLEFISFGERHKMSDAKVQRGETREFNETSIEAGWVSRWTSSHYLSNRLWHNWKCWINELDATKVWCLLGSTTTKPQKFFQIRSRKNLTVPLSDKEQYKWEWCVCWTNKRLLSSDVHWSNFWILFIFYQFYARRWDAKIDISKMSTRGCESIKGESPMTHDVELWFFVVVFGLEMKGDRSSRVLVRGFAKTFAIFEVVGSLEFCERTDVSYNWICVGFRSLVCRLVG